MGSESYLAGVISWFVSFRLCLLRVVVLLGLKISSIRLVLS
jgi:hypothetical protein